MSEHEHDITVKHDPIHKAEWTAECSCGWTTCSFIDPHRAQMAGENHATWPRRKKE